MVRLHSLAWHHGARSNAVCETRPTRAAGRGLQVERRHGIANAIGSTNDIILEPGPVSIHSTAGLGSLSPRAADCADADALVTPADYATDDSFDFGADRRCRNDRISRTNPSTTG